MKVLYGLKNLHISAKGSVVTIGVFDGVHIGHARVIRKALAGARSAGLPSVVITFDPHPSKVLEKSKAAASLISLAHRIRLIESMSPDYIVVLHFSRALASIAPEAFARDILVARAAAKEVYIGDNFYFGKKAAAGASEMKALGGKLGFKVTVVPAVKSGAHRVSSSRIRILISRGCLDGAAKFLGRPVSVLGTVVSGANLARELGYPTANLNPHHEIIPPGGVYAVLVRYCGRLFKGVLNIGLRPTFYAPRDREPAIEVHIFGFSGNVYGKDMEVFFVKKIRDERRFKGKEALIRQIEKDKKAALAILHDLKPGNLKIS
jgi:riboflavin kinase / FMN adenylyltransferase